MIGKVTIGKSFRGCLMYCLNDKRIQHPEEEIFKNRAEIISFNQCSGNTNQLVNQFNHVRELNPKLSKPVLHITLSLSPNEYLSKDKLMEIAEHCAKDFGFESNQYVAVLHKDKEHQHIHIVANRIGFDKKTVSDSNNYQKLANFCRKTELKYGLRQVLSPKKFLSKEQRNLPRQDERKKQLNITIRKTIHKSKSLDHFVAMMQAQGYKVIKGRGISFIDDKKVKIKGSEVDYSLQKIESHIQTLNRLSTDREFFKQVNERKPLIDSTETIINVPIKNENIFVTYKLIQDVSKTVDSLLKPEQTLEQINPSLLVKKKERKKKRWLHL
ncbi:MAG: relaxase/mobilization nuclease domain-containing protein [Parafilimonas sp.]